MELHLAEELAIACRRFTSDDDLDPRRAQQHCLAQCDVVALQEARRRDLGEPHEALFTLEIGEQARLDGRSLQSERRCDLVEHRVALERCPRFLADLSAVSGCRGEDGLAQRLGRMAGECLEIAAVLQQLRQALVNLRLRQVAERLVRLGLDLPARLADRLGE